MGGKIPKYWEDNRQEGQGSPNGGTGHKCETYFISPLSGRRKLQVSDFFSLKILCCQDDTCFQLNLTSLKPWDNQYTFVMEMFFLSYVNETMYLFWNLPFFKMVPLKTNFWLITAQQTSIHINCFMAGRWHILSHTVSKMQVVGEGPGETPSASRCLSYLINSFLTEGHKTSGWRLALSAPLLMSVSETFSIPFYTLIKLCYTKALEWSRLVHGSKVKSSSSEIQHRSPQAINTRTYGTQKTPKEKKESWEQRTTMGPSSFLNSKQIRMPEESKWCSTCSKIGRETKMNHKEGILKKFTCMWPNELCQGSKITKWRKDGLLNNQKKGNL